MTEKLVQMQVVWITFDRMAPFSPVPEAESFTRLWSNASQWPNGAVPHSGEDVDIPAAWRLVMDVQPPPLGLLRIYGSLAFDPNRFVAPEGFKLCQSVA